MFAAEIFYRSWIAANGYRWVRYKDIPEPKGRGIGGIPPNYYKQYQGEVLTEIHSRTDPKVLRRYQPCEPFQNHPTLYREFASIPWGDRAAAIAFASKYGMLDSNRMMGTVAYSLPQGVQIRGRNSFVPADPQEDWSEGPAMLRAMIRVWEHPEEHEVVFRWQACGDQYCWVWYPAVDDGPTRQGDKSGLVCRMVYREWDTPDFNPETEGKRETTMIPSRPWTGTEKLEEIAQAFIRQELSKQLGYTQCTLRLRPHLAGQIAFQVVPGNMLQAFFLQFGQAYAGNKQHRQCPICLKWFELVPQDKGRKEFCSAGCKVKEYRIRKQRAVQLKREGRTPKQIAEAIHTPLETVQGWLKHKPLKKRKDD